MTRGQKDRTPPALSRFVVTVLDEDTGHVAHRVEAQDLPVVLAGTKLGDLVLFTSKEDGTLWAVSVDLVKDIQEETQDPSGDWVLREVHDPQTMGQNRK